MLDWATPFADGLWLLVDLSPHVAMLSGNPFKTGSKRKDLTPPLTTSQRNVLLGSRFHTHQSVGINCSTFKLERCSQGRVTFITSTWKQMLSLFLFPFQFPLQYFMLLYKKRGLQTPYLSVLSWMLIWHDSAKFANWSGATTQGSRQKQPGLANTFKKLPLTSGRHPAT